MFVVSCANAIRPFSIIKQQKYLFHCFVFVSPMAALISTQECHTVRSVVVLPDGGDSNTEYEPPSSHTKLPVDKYAPCILDVDVEKGNSELPKFNGESVANLKSSDDFLTRSLLRKNCLQIGIKFMQLLMSHGTELPKFTSRDKLVADRVHDTPNNNRTRKFKRSASFNSRRVVLLFSVLSSMGTIILIYLTLRVRQISGKV